MSNSSIDYVLCKELFHLLTYVYVFAINKSSAILMISSLSHTDVCFSTSHNIMKVACMSTTFDLLHKNTNSLDLWNTNPSASGDLRSGAKFNKNRPKDFWHFFLNIYRHKVFLNNVLYFFIF